MESGASTSVFQTLALFNFGLLNVVMFLGLLLFQIGMMRAKNTTAIIANNTIMFALVIITYLFLGQQIIYGRGASETFLFAFVSKALKISTDPAPITTYHPRSAAFFQLFLPMISLTIVAATTGERLKLWAFLLFSLIYTIIIYPFLGAALWGHGFLHQLGFIDRAGSACVYLLGAMAGLTGTIILGPRLDKLQHQLLLPSHMPLLALGAFFIWFGSVGFNSGVHELGEPLQLTRQFQHVLINTFCVGAASLLSAAIISRIAFGAVDMTFAFNGLLCGLAAIAAHPAYPNPYVIFLLGLSCGCLAIPVCMLTEKIGIDDPTGSAAVLTFGGIMGLLTAAFTVEEVANQQFMQVFIQSCGILVTITWGVFASTMTWLIIHFIIGLRVSADVETRGLDIYDCAMPAYPKFENNLK